MEANGRGSTAVAGGVALTLAGCGGLSLAVGQAVWLNINSPGSESVVVLLSIVGVMVLVMAAIIGGFVAVDLIGAVVSRDRPALIEITLGVLCSSPLSGSGGGSA